MIVRRRARRGERMEWLMSAWRTETDECILDWPFSTTKGYPSVSTRACPMLANRFLCELEHGSPPGEGYQAAHSCGARRCLNKRHLRWATPAENNEDKRAHGTLRHGTDVNFARLAESDVVAIRRSLRQGALQRKLAEAYGVHPSTISRIATGDNWKEVT